MFSRAGGARGFQSVTNHGNIVQERSEDQAELLHGSSARNDSMRGAEVPRAFGVADAAWGIPAGLLVRISQGQLIIGLGGYSGPSYLEAARALLCDYGAESPQFYQ
jgi:hypothetical protein